MREIDEKTHLIDSVSEMFGSINTNITSNNETNKPLREGRQRTARYVP
jgi:hypothetical protein